MCLRPGVIHKNAVSFPEDRVSHGLRPHQLGYTSWPASTKSPPISTSQALGFRVHSTIPTFSCGFSRPQACKSTALLTELSPQPLSCFLFKKKNVTHNVMAITRPERSPPFSCHVISLTRGADREPWDAANATQRKSQCFRTRSRALSNRGNK